MGAGDRNEKELGFPGCYTQGCCDVNWDGGYQGGERYPGQNGLLGEGGMSKKR